MPDIWTLQGNSSTARSGWVAADAAQQPCRFCLPGACELRSAQKNPSYPGSLTPTGGAGASLATIPRAAAQISRPKHHL